MDDLQLKISLPNTILVQKFQNFCMIDKLKILELGVSAWISAQRDAKKNQSSEIKKITAIHEEQLKNTISQVKSTERNLIKSEINYLKETISEKDVKLKQFYSEMEHRTNQINSNWQKKYEEIFEQKIKNNQNSTIIGQEGEAEAQEYLTMCFPKATIDDSHTEDKRGDFLVTDDDGFTMLVEVKKYKKNVNKGEIKLFYDRIDESVDVKCGILVSIQTGICCRDHFQLEFRNNRPILFLSNLRDNIFDLKIAHKLCKQLCDTGLDFSDEEKLCKLNNTIAPIKRNINKMKKSVAKHQKEMEQCIETQLQSLAVIIDLLRS